MKNITLTNDFHNSKSNVRINDGGKETILSRSVAGRVRRDLCGINGCTCGGVLGQRGNGNRGLDIAEMPNGEAMIREVEND